MALNDETIVLEDISSEMETEVTIYAQYDNLAGLKEATYSEGHVQVEAEFAKANNCRVRKTLEGANINYVYTYKVKRKNAFGKMGKKEHNVTVDEEFFEDFKLSAGRLLCKKRYVFDSQVIKIKYEEDGEEKILSIPGNKFEVDMFIKTDGTVSAWCKIDIELDQAYAYLKKTAPQALGGTFLLSVEHLPIKPKNCILDVSATDEQKKTISAIWDNEFIAPL